MHVFFGLSESVTQEKSQNLSILGSGGWRRSTDILLLIGMFHYLWPVWEDGGFWGGGGSHQINRRHSSAKTTTISADEKCIGNKTCNLCNHLGLGTSMV